MLVDGRSGSGDLVTSAIRSASRTTGANFDYLLNTAIRESSLNPTARARTSSARGLYQFIESTWLTMVKEEGAKFGLGQQAEAITRGADGQYRVNDPKARAEILKLRDDPGVSSVMAGALAKRNAGELSSFLGRKPTSGELYLAHFLGVNGAKRLIQLERTNPNASAAAAFPDAAQANRSIFHGAGGKARNVSEVLAQITGQHDTKAVKPKAAPSSTAFAALRPTLSSDPVSKPLKNGPAPREAYAHRIAPGRTAFAPEEGPAHHTLFRTGGAKHATLSPAVKEIWGSFESNSRGLQQASTDKGAGSIAGEPLDLLGHLKNRPARNSGAS
jgi:hypothetical protein